MWFAILNALYSYTMQITTSIIGHTMDVVGKLLIAWVTLRLHTKHFKLHTVEKKDIRLDIWLSTLGMLLMIAGYILRFPEF